MKKAIMIPLVLLILLGIGWISYEKTYGHTTPPTREPTTDAPTETTLPVAPDFTVYDKDGNAVQLSSFLGKPVVLNFWASWCGPCKMEMPEFEEKYLEQGEEVVFIMLNVTTSESSQSDGAELIAQLGYSFPVYYDLTGQASASYGISAFPTTFFINAKGEAVARAVGAIDGATLQKGLEMIR